jgi:flagellar basal-body rod modification protein FlgD
MIMDVSSVTASVANSSTQSQTSTFLTGDDFMKVLLTQLQYQDPLKPMDNQQMVEQMSTIRQLEMNTNLSQKLEQLTDQQRFGAAAALIGHQVKGTVEDENGTAFSMQGLVKSVKFTSKGDVMLELDSGETLPLANLEEVTDAGTSLSATSATDLTAKSTTGATSPIQKLLNKIVIR